MTSYTDELTPIPVQVDWSNQPKPAKAKPCRRAATLTTVIISATNPVVKLLPGTGNRCSAYLINYTDADVVICSSESIANKVASLVDFTEQVDGAIVPKSFATPVPLDTTDDLWVTTNATVIAAGPTRVSVLDYMYGD